MSDIILQVKDLHTRYITRSNEAVYAVDGVSFDLKEGGTLGIAGESGCGKSTLAMSLLGYYFAPLHYTSGQILVDGKDLTAMEPDDVRQNILGHEIAYIPQAAMNALNPTRQVMKFIIDVIRAHDPQAKKKDIQDLARERFELLNLPLDSLYKFPVELSGGMKQRVVIAISSLLNPRVLIADEPSSALDVSSQKLVIAMLLDLIEKNLVSSMIFITHELPLLYHVTDDIAVMYAGQFVEKGKAHPTVFEPLHPYSKGLMGSIITPEEGFRDKPLAAIPGTPPNLKHPPEGCRFAARCRLVRRECIRFPIDEYMTDDDRMFRCIIPEDELRATSTDEVWSFNPDKPESVGPETAAWSRPTDLPAGSTVLVNSEHKGEQS